MKRFLAKQFVNIVFIVLIVAAALTIYFLSRSDQKVDAASASATPVVTPEPKAVFSGVPEEVLLTHLITAESFSAEPAKDGDRVWEITIDKPQIVSARFSYTVDLGAVTDFTLSLPLPAEASARSESDIDQAVAATKEERQAIWCQAVITMLTDLVPTCDADDAIPETTVRLWAVKASSLSSAGDSYTNEAGGGLFCAYITSSGDGLSLVCSLTAPS